MIRVVPAGALHHREMAEILNQIIKIGGTTAIITPVDTATIGDWMARNPDQSAWFVAEDETGLVLGFQWIEPNPSLPEDAANIATFSRPGHTGLGIGSKLFEATKIAASKLGYSWINANIRADNEGGLAYYQSRGFENYGTINDHPLADGTRVNKVLKRFDL